MTYATAKDTRQYTLTHSVLIAFSLMGFALANRYITILGQACSLGIILHTSFFFVLYWVDHRYGTKHVQTILLALLCFVAFSIGIGSLLLYSFPQRATTPAPTAIWELRCPMHVAIPFLVTTIGYYSLSIGKHTYPVFYTFAMHGVMLCICSQYCDNTWGNVMGYGLTTIALLPCYLFLVQRTLPVAIQEDSVYQILVIFFGGICLLTNLWVVKHITVWHHPVTLAVFIYPLTFTLTDLLSELYGHKTTLNVVWSGLLTNMLILAIVGLSTLWPMHPSSPVSDACFRQSFGFVESTIIASMITYIIVQILDIYLFATLRYLMKGHHLWLRNNVATILSQFVDTAFFAMITWQIWQYVPPKTPTLLTWNTWWDIALHEYIWKVVLALCDTPLIYLLLSICRRWNRAYTYPSHKKP